jgi:heme A synthase
MGLIGVMFIGMTGSIAALGDTLFPSMSFTQGFRQDFDTSSHFLLRLRGLHPLVAIVISFLLVGLARIQAAARGTIRRLSNLLIGLTVIQVLAGVMNLVLLAPVWLQLLHLLLADLVWITLVLYTDRSLRGGKIPVM